MKDSMCKYYAVFYYVGDDIIPKGIYNTTFKAQKDYTYEKILEIGKEVAMWKLSQDFNYDEASFDQNNITIINILPLERRVNG